VNFTCLFIGDLMTTEEEMRPYAPVLARVVDLVTKNSGLSYGDALEQAMQTLGIAVPPAVQDAILIVVFKISTNGFPNAVDA